jgi:ankyrin repeat protein
MSVNSAFSQSSQKSPAASELVEAARRNDIDAVKILLQQGADPNEAGQWGHTALMHAAENNNVEMAHLFIKTGADIDARDINNTPALVVAAIYGTKEIVRLLIGEGAEIDMHASSVASYNGHPEIAQMLKNPDEIRRQFAEAAETERQVVEKTKADRTAYITSPALHRDMPAPKVLRLTPTGKK